MSSIENDMIIALQKQVENLKNEVDKLHGMWEASERLRRGEREKTERLQMTLKQMQESKTDGAYPGDKGANMGRGQY